jgi:hypothetical protein
MAGDQDMEAHAATYSGVIDLLKWGALGCGVIVAIVIWLIH